MEKEERKKARKKGALIRKFLSRGQTGKTGKGREKDALENDGVLLFYFFHSFISTVGPNIFYFAYALWHHSTMYNKKQKWQVKKI